MKYELDGILPVRDNEVRQDGMGMQFPCPASVPAEQPLDFHPDLDRAVCIVIGDCPPFISPGSDPVPYSCAAGGTRKLPGIEYDVFNTGPVEFLHIKL